MHVHCPTYKNCFSPIIAPAKIRVCNSCKTMSWEMNGRESGSPTRAREEGGRKSLKGETPKENPLLLLPLRGGRVRAQGTLPFCVQAILFATFLKTSGGRTARADGRTDRRKQFDSQNATRGDRASSSRRSAAEQTSGVVSVDHSRDPKFAGRCFSPSKTWFMPRSSEWRSSFPPLSPLPSHGSISVKSQGRRERERERERGESSFQTIRLPVLPATRVNPPMERLTN